MQTIIDSIRAYLSTIKGTRMASIRFVVDVKPAAKFKNVVIKKDVKASIQLFGTISDYKVFVNQVKRSAAQILENDKEKVANFTPATPWFIHPDSSRFSLVEHPKTKKQYIYAVFNSSKSSFTIDGKPASREEVANYLTPSDAKNLLADNSTIYNKANDIYHTTICRTVALDNIITFS